MENRKGNFRGDGRYEELCKRRKVSNFRESFMTEDVR